MATPSRPMTDHDVKVAGDIGEMKSDVRTLKHDVANIQQGQIALSASFQATAAALSEKLNTMSNQQSKGLGFFAGAASIITLFGGAMLFLAKALFGGVIASGRVHP